MLFTSQLLRLASEKDSLEKIFVNPPKNQSDPKATQITPFYHEHREELLYLSKNPIVMELDFSTS